MAACKCDLLYKFFLLLNSYECFYIYICVCVFFSPRLLTQNSAIIALLPAGLILWLPHGDVFILLA